MKFTELTAYIHRDLFDNGNGSRIWIDTYLLFELLKELQPKKILEIGYFKGFTFSVMYECLNSTAEYFTSCDITYANDVASKLLNFKKCEFIEDSSVNLKLTKKYDFVNIDGLHKYHPVIEELKLCYAALDDNGIIMVDDYLTSPGVVVALNEFLLEYPDIKPVLIGHQQIFLSKLDISKSALDSIIKNTSTFLSWDHSSQYSHIAIPWYRGKLDTLQDKFTSIVKITDNRGTC